MTKILSYIVGFFSFLGDLFKGIGLIVVKFFQILLKCGDFLISVIGSLPTVITVVVIGIVIICVVYKVLGREGQG